MKPSDTLDWKKLSEKPSFRWPCACLICGFNWIWVVRAGCIIMQKNGTFVGEDESVEAKENGYPLFWRRGRLFDEKDKFGQNWTDDISGGNHYANKQDGEIAAAEAVLLHPTLIGNVDVLQFRIR